MGRLMYRMYVPMTDEEVLETLNGITYCKPIEMPKAVVELIEMEITSCYVTKEERQELMDFLDSVLVKEEEHAS